MGLATECDKALNQSPDSFSSIPVMDKSTAFELLGGDVHTVARHLGCGRSAVDKWPKTGPLPRLVADRVLAARVRMRGELLIAKGIQLDPLEARALS